MQEKILRLQTKENGNDKLFCTARYLLFVDYIFLKKTKLKPSFRTKIVKKITQTINKKQIHKTKLKETMRKTLIPFPSTISQWEKQHQHKTIQNTYCSTQMYNTHYSHTKNAQKKTPQAKNMNVFYKCFLLIYVKKYTIQRRKSSINTHSAKWTNVMWQWKKGGKTKQSKTTTQRI